YSFDYTFVKKDGSKVPANVIINWLQEEQSAYCIIRDISELIKAREAVKQKEEFYQALVEHGSDLLTLLDENGVYTYLSNNFSKATGYTAYEMLGQCVFNLIHPDDLPVITEYWN